MATVASSLKVLNLYFQDEGSDKLHKVRVPYPAENLTPQQVQAAGEAIAKTQMFDFSGAADPFHFVKATRYARKQQSVIK